MSAKASLTLFGRKPKEKGAGTEPIQMPKDLPQGTGEEENEEHVGGGIYDRNVFVMPKDKPSGHETAGLSIGGAVTRARGKQAKLSSTPIKFRETDVSGVPQGTGRGRRFKAILIQEGLGNIKDCYYYTKEAIASGVAVFEGCKFFIDHPSESEEMDRPERSVRDVAGHFENLSVNFAAEDGRAQLMGDLLVIDGPIGDQAVYLMNGSLTYANKYPGKDLIGLSINGDGASGSVGLESFMQENEIPESCLPKLLNAQAEGLTVIRPVVAFTSAVSCDLVTAAGAGGKIAHLLEQEKNRMGKRKVKEAKREETRQEGEEESGGDGATGAPGANADDADGSDDSSDGGDDSGHDDSDQDAELIRQMLNEYLGDGHDEETMALGHQAMKNAKAMGMDDKEAYKCAGYNMKMAKYMQKQSKQEGEEEEGEEAPAPNAGPGDPGPSADGGPPTPAAGGPDGSNPNRGAPQNKSKVPPGKNTQQAEEAEEEEEDGAPMSQESARKELRKARETITRLSGENSRLLKENETLKMGDFVEKTLRESRLPFSATKKFRECIKDARSQKEVMNRLKIFKEGMGIGGEADGLGFFIETEKVPHEGGSGGLSFADCHDSDE
jgi:hypothetical protein